MWNIGRSLTGDNEEQEESLLGEDSDGLCSLSTTQVLTKLFTQVLLFEIYATLTALYCYAIFWLLTKQRIYGFAACLVAGLACMLLVYIYASPVRRSIVVNSGRSCCYRGGAAMRCDIDHGAAWFSVAVVAAAIVVAHREARSWEKCFPWLQQGNAATTIGVSLSFQCYFSKTTGEHQRYHRRRLLTFFCLLQRSSLASSAFSSAILRIAIIPAIRYPAIPVWGSAASLHYLGLTTETLPILHKLVFDRNLIFEASIAIMRKPHGSLANCIAAHSYN
ncbi:hypothetical protein CR513_01896, partial [Mucuna pruriens]